MLFSQEPLRLQSHCTSPVPNCKFDLSSLNTFYVDFCRAHPQGAVSLGSPLSVLAPVAAASTHLSATVVRSFFFFVLVTLGYFWLPITLLLLSRAGRAPGLGAPAGQGLRLCSPQRVPGGRGSSTDDSRFLPCSFFFPNSCVVVVLLSAYGSLSVSLDHVILN